MFSLFWCFWNVSYTVSEKHLPEVIEDIERSSQIIDILSREKVLSVDCEGISLGVDGPLTLVQVGTYSGEVYLFDIQHNKDLLKRGKLGEILESNNVVKVMFRF